MTMTSNAAMSVHGSSCNSVIVVVKLFKKLSFSSQADVSDVVGQRADVVRRHEAPAIKRLGAVLARWQIFKDNDRRPLRQPDMILRSSRKGRSMQFIETAVSKDFTREVALPESAMNLARAGLLFAQAEYPQLDCDWYLGQLDLIAADISARSDPDADLGVRLAVMNEYLFGDLGYSGNMDDYYDPRNSYLNEVIDRRIGLPITLSIVFLELAQRVGLRARGISFPGHFLVSVSEGNGDIIVDAFDGGVCLARATFLERLQERAEANTSLVALESALAPASKADILLRQLRNLQAVYIEQGEAEQSLNVANHMLTINPDLVPELLERAGLYNSLGYSRGAVVDYEHALTQMPAGDLQAEVRERLGQAKEQAQHLH